MESMHVYQTIPHPGIQGSLESYYEDQVGRVSRESSPGRAGPRGGAGVGGMRLQVLILLGILSYPSM